MIGQVEDNQYSENINIFAEKSYKESLTNNHYDLFMRLYLRFIHGNLPFDEITIHDLNK